MKEYGVDLKKQYDKLLKDTVLIAEKIKKRRQFLIKNATPEVLKIAAIDTHSTDNVVKMLDDIVRIEKAYTEQSKQLDMFLDK